MRHYFSKILTVMLVSSSLFCNAQIIKTSSHGKSINQSKDSLKVLWLNERSWECRIQKQDSALYYAQKARLIAEKIGFRAGISTSLSRIAEIERQQGNNTQAISTINKSLEIEKELNNANGIIRAYEHLTLLYTNTNEYEKAFEAGQACINLCKESNRFLALANAYDRQAILYKYKGKFDKALELIYSSLDIREQIEDSTNIVCTYMNLASIYNRLLNYNKALEFNNKAIELALTLNDQSNLAKIYTNISSVYYNLKQINMAIDYNFKSIKIKEDLKQDETIDTNYDNLGLCYYELGDYDQAIKFYNSSISIINKNDDKRNLSTVYTNLGNLYFNKKQYKLALSYYHKGLENSTLQDNQLNTIELYQNIYKSYSIMGELDKAISYNNRYIALRDSFDTSYRNAIELKDAFQEEQKKNQLLTKDKQLNELKIKRRNILVISLSGGIILLLLLMFASFRNYAFRQKALLAEKNNEINKQKISELLKDQELKSMSAMLEGQEGERKRIAQDLHDRLGSMLSMVKLHFKSVEENIQTIRETNLVMYSKANNLLDEACEEVRKIANDLNSGVLNKFGLIPALKSLKDSIEGTGQLKIEVLSFGFDDNRLDYSIEINLYRIIQEFIINTLKHAKASEVNIQLLKKEKRLNIVVEDNGIGFELNKIKNKTGMGLRNIESRVNSLNGELNIDSGRGAGTTFTIDIPLNYTQ